MRGDTHVSDLPVRAYIGDACPILRLHTDLLAITPCVVVRRRRGIFVKEEMMLNKLIEEIAEEE